MKHKRRVLLLIILTLFLLACSTSLLPTATPTAQPTPTATSTATPIPTRTPLPDDSGWVPLVPGISLRSRNVQTGEVVERISIARFDPKSVELRILYAAEQPQLVSEWAKQNNALLVINAGYFTPEYLVTGLTISNGEVHGNAYDDFAGMLAVTPQGDISVRWLRERPYDPQEGLREAVQAFPVLVKPGGVMGFPADADEGYPARRTVVAQDRSGCILFIVAPRGYLSLHALAVYLAESDLDIDVALNLDGGTSSGLWINDAQPHMMNVESLTPVPAVIAVFQR